MRFDFPLFAAATLMVLLSTPAPAARPAGTEPSDELITRVYDVSDLIRPPRTYATAGMAPPGMPPGVGGPGFGGLTFGPGMEAAPGAPEPAAINGNGLATLVINSIAPESWRPGADGTITVQRGLLIVSQTPQRQARIADLLAQLRQTAPMRTVTIRADWILIDPSQLQEILKAPDDKAKPGAIAEVDPNALAHIALKAHYQGQISCFNGQTVHIASMRERTMVSGLEPVVANQVVGYKPQLTQAQAGATLQVMPEVAADGASAVLDLESLVTEWNDAPEVTKQPPTSGPASQGARSDAGIGTLTITGAGDSPAVGTLRLNGVIDGRTLTIQPDSPWGLIDRQSVTTQQFRTSLRIPTGKPVVVGGMTMGPSIKSRDSAQLYLIIELNAASAGG